ncbi:hypothetical protein SEA_SATIS_162 [Streptomyces phage Satis]|nr:hypothetical protein SEA_SATIS_162 [Streptomyces phage Satis]
MDQPVTPVVSAAFDNPEEGTTATVDRLVMAASYWKISDSALRTLIYLTALACSSDKVISMTIPTADLDELERRGLARRDASRSDRVVLL